MFFRFTGNLPSVGCAKFIFDEVGQAGHVGSYNPLHIRITQTQLYISDAVEGNDSVLHGCLAYLVAVRSTDSKALLMHIYRRFCQGKQLNRQN